jgi:hypothetical protein
MCLSNWLKPQWSDLYSGSILFASWRGHQQSSLTTWLSQSRRMLEWNRPRLSTTCSFKAHRTRVSLQVTGPWINISVDTEIEITFSRLKYCEKCLIVTDIGISTVTGRKRTYRYAKNFILNQCVICTFEFVVVPMSSEVKQVKQKYYTCILITGG